MPDEIHTILRKQIGRLESERSLLDRQLDALRGALGALDGGGRGPRPEAAPRQRRAMSAAARRAVGKRMKAYWAKRRAERQKAAKGAKRSK